MEDDTKFTELELDGKTFRLKYDFDAVIQAEEMTDTMLLFGGGMRAKRMRGMLLALMLPAHPETKAKDLNKYIVHRNTEKILEALGAAWAGGSESEA